MQHIYSKEYTSDRWDLSQFIWVLFNIGYIGSSELKYTVRKAQLIFYDKRFH